MSVAPCHWVVTGCLCSLSGWQSACCTHHGDLMVVTGKLVKDGEAHTGVSCLGAHRNCFSYKLGPSPIGRHQATVGVT